MLQLVTRLVGGAAQEAAILTRTLPKHGFDARLLTGPEREGSDWGLSGDRARVIPSLQRRLDPRSDLTAFRSMLRVMRWLKPAVVHTHMSKVGVLGRVAAWRTGAPVVIHSYHGHVLKEHFSVTASEVFRLVERRLARITDVLVAVSGSDRDELLALGIGQPSQWRVVPIGVHVDDIVAARLSPREARIKLGLPVEGSIVGTVGRLSAIKDQETFLRAARRLAHRDPTVSFVVAGDGELRAELERRSRFPGLPPIRFLGWVTDRGALYRALDVVVLTSRREGTPSSLIEAGVAGRPVVATRVGGVPDVVREGITGFIVPPGDDEGIAERILNLLGDPQRARAMGASARAWVAGRFSVAQNVEALAQLYDELVASKAPVDSLELSARYDDSRGGAHPEEWRHHSRRR